MSAIGDYLSSSRKLIDRVAEQASAIEQAADWFSQTILAGRMVHVFGSGHSRIMVEEMWPRYGSFPGFNPIVELSLTFHNAVVGANGQRQAMHLENVPGLAERILRNFGLSEKDSALLISSSGCNVVPIEMASYFSGEKSVLWPSSAWLMRTPRQAVARMAGNSRTLLIWCLIPERPSVMRWCARAAWKPRFHPVQPWVAAC